MTDMPLQFGVTQRNTCSYLTAQQEQLIVLISPEPIDSQLYQQLITHNFRRSGDQLYRPHCPACTACQSLRIPAQQFIASAAQRRIAAKARRDNWHYQLTPVGTDADEHALLFNLFSRYIAYKHADSVMYPATVAQFQSLLSSTWQPIYLLKLYQDTQLMAVTVVDVLPTSYSAVYSFFAPEAAQYSPGKLAILYLLAAAQSSERQFVYLGYQVDGCKKMAYKSEFMPHQRFLAGYWHSFA